MRDYASRTSLVFMFICFVAVCFAFSMEQQFLPFTCTRCRGGKELERAGYCACEPLRPSRTSEGGSRDFQECKWHFSTWAGVGMQVNACLAAVLLDVSSVKSQVTLDSFFPVFIFRLARPICSPHGNVGENYFFSFLILLSKARLKANQTCLFWMSFPSLLDEAWRGASWNTGLGKPILCVLSCDPGTGP